MTEARKTMSAEIIICPAAELQPTRPDLEVAGVIAFPASWAVEVGPIVRYDPLDANDPFGRNNAHRAVQGRQTGTI